MDSIQSKIQPLLLEVGTYEGLALVFKAIGSPWSSPVAWFGVLVAIVRLLALVSKSYHQHQMDKIKLREARERELKLKEKLDGTD